MSSTVASHLQPTAVRIVLLRDARWPDVPGVCCWRDSVRTAFQSAGGSVTDLTWTSPVGPVGGAGGGQQSRVTWLPPAVRQPAARLYRAGRRTAHRLARARAGRAARGTGLPPGLADASLVIAESVEVAMAAVAAGSPRRRMWALALPAERLNGAERAGYAVDVVRAAQTLAGFLTDSEPARESLERAAAASRPRTEVFPPLATDRACPHHGTAPPALAPREPASDPEPPHPAVAQLMLWRAHLDAPADAEAEAAYPFAAARLRGSVRDWAATPEPGWREEPVGAAPAPVADDAVPASAPDWSTAAQEAAARRIRDAILAGPVRPARRTRSALVAGYDLKFAGDLAQRLDNRNDLDVTVDEWRALSRGTEHTKQRLRQAESIFAEWARTSAVWYSQHKRPDQFLAVRLHRFELDAPYPREIEIDNVDAVVYIAPLFGRRIRDELGWPLDKLVYIPNFLDLDWLARPKLPRARFAIGFVGIEQRRKRFDLALDLLAAVRREDPRFRLVVRSSMPWQNQYAWAEPAERNYVGRCFERIEQDPLLRHGVVFEAPGRDMARWFRRVGHILSTSDEEGCHTAVGEGMASGAVPVVRSWPGAAEIYDKPWIHATINEAAATVLTSVDADVWAERAARAKSEIARSHDPAAVVDAWADLLHGGVERARTYFAAYSNLQPADLAAPPATPAPRRTTGTTGTTGTGR